MDNANPSGSLGPVKLWPEQKGMEMARSSCPERIENPCSQLRILPLVWGGGGGGEYKKV